MELKTKIAIVTYEDRGSYATENVLDEDDLLMNLLHELNLDFQLEVWSDTKVNWTSYSHLLIKSPWDYFDRYEKFKSWCNKIQSLGLKVYNDVNTILWNSHKRYLLDIEKLGFPIVPTEILEKGSKVDITKFFKQFNTDQLIVKPAVSGGAKNTIKVHLNEVTIKNDRVNQWLIEEDFMVQPFINEVERIGEYSYIYFNQQFSHAVLKSPKTGDFRVQHFFGGQITSIAPSEAQINYFNNLMRALNLNTLYARIDGVWMGDKFYLMELELIEPYLFLFTHPDAIHNYKNSIQETFKSKSFFK